MMKNSKIRKFTPLHLCVGILLLSLVACETESPYLTEPTILHYEITGLMGTQATLRVTPEDNRSYYYYAVVKEDELQSVFHLSDKHLMMLCMDSIYRDYLDWRYPYLVKDVPYIADFRSHSLYYGESEKFLTNLTPNTDYQVLGFCVNPETREAIGALQRYSFTTTDIDTTYVSPIVFDFGIEMYVGQSPVDGNANNMAIISIRPSVEGHPTKDQYICGLISEENLNAYYDGNLYQYAGWYVSDILVSPDMVEYLLCSDITLRASYDMQEGATYYVLAAPYLITWPKSLYYRRFEYHVGTSLSYSHDTVQP